MITFLLVGCAVSRINLYVSANHEENKIVHIIQNYQKGHDENVRSLKNQIDQALKEKNIEKIKTLLKEFARFDSNQEYEGLSKKVALYDALKDVKVGDSVHFGTYIQEGNEKEPISWIVLAKEGNRILVTSKYILEASSYHDEQVDITWEDCSLRKFLNEEFYKEAFSSEEQECIETVKEDSIFLLSVEQAKTYFEDDASRMGYATKYAKDKGVYVYKKNQGTYYWLIDQGKEKDKAAYVFASGEITKTSIEGLDVYENNTDGGVRPAMYIQTDIFEMEQTK